LAVAGGSDNWRKQDFREEIAHIQQRLREIEREAPGLIASAQFHNEFVTISKLLDKYPIDENDIEKLNEIVAKLEHEAQFVVNKEHAKGGDRIKKENVGKYREAAAAEMTIMEKIKSYLPGTKEHAATKSIDNENEYWKEFRRQHEKDWDKDEKDLKDKYNKKKGEWRAKYETWKESNPEWEEKEKEWGNKKDNNWKKGLEERNEKAKERYEEGRKYAQDKLSDGEMGDKYEGKEEIKNKYKEGRKSVNDKWDQTKADLDAKKDTIKDKVVDKYEQTKDYLGD